jgi:hypothetical protein
MVPALKSSDHTIKCACGNCDAVLLLHAEDAQAIATTPQEQRGGANLAVGGWQTAAAAVLRSCRG